MTPLNVILVLAENEKEQLKGIIISIDDLEIKNTYTSADNHT